MHVVVTIGKKSVPQWTKDTWLMAVEVPVLSMSFDSSLDPVGFVETTLLSICVSVFTKVVPFSIKVFRCWF